MNKKNNIQKFLEAGVALMSVLTIFTLVFVSVTQPLTSAQSTVIDPNDSATYVATTTATTTQITTAMNQINTAQRNLLAASTTLAAQRAEAEAAIVAMVAMVIGEAEKQATQTITNDFGNITQEASSPLNQLAQLNTLSQSDIQSLISSSIQTMGVTLTTAQQTQLLTNVTQSLSVPNLSGGIEVLSGVITQNVSTLTGISAATLQSSLLAPLTINTSGTEFITAPNIFMNTVQGEIREQVIENMTVDLRAQLTFGMSNTDISNVLMSSLSGIVPSSINVSGYQNLLNSSMLSSIGNITDSVAYINLLQNQLQSTFTQLQDYQTQLTTELQNQLTGSLLSSFDLPQLVSMTQFTDAASLLSGNLQQNIQNQLGGLVNQLGGQLLSATGLTSLTSLSGVFANGLSLSSLTDLSSLTGSLGNISSLLNTGVIGQFGTITSLLGAGGFGFGAAPFGGRILSVESCSCSGNWRIRLSPPRGGYFMYSPTVTYLYGPPLVVGRWALGTSGGLTVCMRLRKFCSPVGTHNLMTIVGTSQF